MNTSQTKEHVQILLRNINDRKSESVAAFYSNEDQSDLFPDEVQTKDNGLWKLTERNSMPNPGMSPSSRTGLPFMCYAFYERVWEIGEEADENGAVDEGEVGE